MNLTTVAALLIGVVAASRAVRAMCIGGGGKAQCSRAVVALHVAYLTAVAAVTWLAAARGAAWPAYAWIVALLMTGAIAGTSVFESCAGMLAFGPESLAATSCLAAIYAFPAAWTVAATHLVRLLVVAAVHG